MPCCHATQVIVEAGAIGPLVALLNSDDASVFEQAAGALATLSSSGATLKERGATLVQIVKQGAIAPLITLLDDSRSEIARRHAASALSELALVSSHREAISRAGGISPLVKVLTDPNAAGLTKKFAAAAIGLLSNEEPGSGPASRQQQEREETQPQQATAANMTSDSPSSATPDDTAESSPSQSQPNDMGTTGGQPALPSVREGSVPTTRGLCRNSRTNLIAEEGAIAPLVALLSRGDAEQEEAAGALRSLADHAVIRPAITESGGIGPLVMMLGGSNPRARANAEGVLVRLSTEMYNRVLIIQQLVSMLESDSIAASEQAAAAIANLARESTANCTSIVDAGGIPPLLALLSGESSKAKENSASAITQLASGSRPTQNAIAKAGGIQLLVGVLTASSSNKNDNSQGQIETIVLHAIWKMAKKNFPNQVALVEAGVIPPLVSMLGNASPDVQLPATGGIECLLQSRDIQAAVVRTGAIAPLCSLSRDGMLETQEQAAAALWRLSIDNAPNKTTISKLGGIESLVKMIVTGGSEKSQRNATGALFSLASKHVENRSAIAKRIVSLLSDRGIFGGHAEPPVAARALSALIRLCGRKFSQDETGLNNLSADCTANQLSIAKAGGIPFIISWLGNDDADAQKEAAHALLALATNNIQTQVLIANDEGLQGLVGVINRGCPEAQEHAALALWHLAYSNENQDAIAKAGAIPALVSMLGADRIEDESRGPELAAVTIVRLTQGNPAVSVSVAKVGGIVPLVKLLAMSGAAARQAAAALAELGLVADNRDAIAHAGGVKPLIMLLGSNTFGTPETAARALAHLARAEDDGVYPTTAHEQLELTTSNGATPSPDEGVESHSRGSTHVGSTLQRGARSRRLQIQQMGGVSRLLAMLDGSNLGIDMSSVRKDGAALWKIMRSAIDDTYAGPGSGESVAIKVGMMEQAAAALSELSFGDADMQESIIQENGIPKLLSLVINGSPASQEFSAATLWHLSTMLENQSRLVDSGCIPELVSLVRSGSPKAQEAACGAISNLARGENMATATTVAPGQVNLDESESEHASSQANMIRGARAARTRSSALQMASALVAQDMILRSIDPSATKAVKLRLMMLMNPSHVVSVQIKVEGDAPVRVCVVPNDSHEVFSHEADDEDEDESDTTTLGAVAKANAIQPIVNLLGVKGATPKAKELAAAALWHLALNPASRDLIALAGGIAPLVGLLDGGTHEAHHHASDALARLANESRDHQSQIAKRLVSLLMANNTSMVQQRAAHALQMLASDNPGSPVIIIKAGAISPLVHLVSTASDAGVKKEAADALETLVEDSDDNKAAVSDLVVLLGTGSPKAQELVLQMLLTLVADASNRRGIAQGGALPKLLQQLSSETKKIQELAAAILSHLVKDSAGIISAVAAGDGMTRFITLLSSTSSEAQAHAATVIVTLSESNEEHRAAIMQAGCVLPLVLLLASKASTSAKAAAAGALACLSASDTEYQDTIVNAGALSPLVGILSADEPSAASKGALAIANLVRGNQGHQEAARASQSIEKLVKLLYVTDRSELPEMEGMLSQAALALAALACDNEVNQSAIAACDGIPRLVVLLQLGVTPAEAASSALRMLAARHSANQVAIAAAGGPLSLVLKLRGDNIGVKTECAEALANIAYSNSDIQATVATLLVKLLSAEASSESAAKAIARLARVGPFMQSALARVKAIPLLVSQLRDTPAWREETLTNTAPTAGLTAMLEGCAALRSLASDHTENQVAIVKEGAMTLLVKIIILVRKHATHLTEPGSPQIGRFFLGNTIKAFRSPAKGFKAIIAAKTAARRFAVGLGATQQEAAQPIRDVLGELQCSAVGALWRLVVGGDNWRDIDEAGGIATLIALLSDSNSETQEAAAGVLSCMASIKEARSAISLAGAIIPLGAVLEAGCEAAKAQAVGCLSLLVIDDAHQEAIAQELVRIMSTSEVLSLDGASNVTAQLAAQSGGWRALEQVGALSHLVRLVAEGTDVAAENATRALAQMADKSHECCGAITQQLITTGHGADARVSLRTAKALKELNATEVGEEDPAWTSYVVAREAAKEHAAGRLPMLPSDAADEGASSYQKAVASELVRVMSVDDDPSALEGVSKIALDLACQHEGGLALENAGTIANLANLVAKGTELAADNAARTLELIAGMEPKWRDDIVQHLQLAGEAPGINMQQSLRTARVLKQIRPATTEDGSQQSGIGMAVLGFRCHARE